MRCRAVGRFRFENGGIAAGLPDFADLYSACTIRTLGVVVADDRGQLRVPLRVRERGDYGNPRDVPESDHRIPNRIA